MNWGYKILVVIIVFLLAMFTMVFIAYKQTNDMVDKNYYDKEMKYQSLIDAADNLNKIGHDSLIRQNESCILIFIPSAAKARFNSGKVEFVKSDDKTNDLAFDFVPDSVGVFEINKEKFKKGIYKLRIQWNDGEKPFYKEQDINIR